MNIDRFKHNPTTFTCDKYAHHVVMDTFLNANNFKTDIFERVEFQKKWSPRLAHHFFWDSTLSNLCFSD